METAGLVLTFPSAEDSARFATALRTRKAGDDEIQVVLSDTKQNMDGATLILLLKGAGALVGTILAFLKLGKELLKRADKPSVIIVFKDRKIELHGEATEADLVKLARVLAGE